MRLGDFEGDTVLGPAGTGSMATLVDRKSRFTIVVKVQSKNADHVHAKIKQRMKELDEQRRRSITFDNGAEFTHCHRLEKHLGMELYFADPGCPYQHGTNENTNGLIRQYFPKGTDFRNVSHSPGAAGGKPTQQPPPRVPRVSKLPVRFSSRKPLPAVAIEFGNRQWSTASQEPSNGLAARVAMP